MTIKINKAILYLFFSIILCSSITLGESIINKKLENEGKFNMEISGLVVKLISSSFNDYASNKDGFKQEIDNYIFKVTKINSELQISFFLDSERIEKKYNIHGYKGGGAKYTIDLIKNEVIDKKFYK